MAALTRTHLYPSPAKLNLFLHVLDQRPDGYHHIQTVFQLINWCDYLQFQRHPTTDIHCHVHQCAPTNPIDPNTNLVLRAADLLKKHSGTTQGATITLFKQIPIGAGLGGGSSNAATTLWALNQLWSLHYSQAELLSLARSLGADVPFFLLGSNAWAEGVGEQLTPLLLTPKWYCIIAPRVSVSTQAAFMQLQSRTQLPTPLQPSQWQQGQNCFTAMATQQHPEIDRALQWLNQHGQGKMSGTGSCVFLSFDTQEEASKIALSALSEWDVRVVQGLTRSPLFDKK